MDSLRVRDMPWCLEIQYVVTKGAVTRVPENIMRRNLLYSGFHTPKAVAYHEPTVTWLSMIGHSLGRMEACVGPSTEGAGTKTHLKYLKSRFC